MRRALLALVVVATLACQPASEPDAGLPGGGGLADAGEPDAGPADAGHAPVTSLVATFGATSGPFSRAQHGLAGDAGLYVEAYFGGDPACPSPSSPTPSRTLIVSGLRWASDGGAQTFADGVRVTLFDFVGNLTTRPLERAVAARAVPVWIEPGVLVSFTLDATFDGGVVRGAFEAPHCASLDGP